MATISIYRSGSIVLTPVIDEQSVLVKSLNGDDYVNLVFDSDSFTELFIGDYISWRGVQYTMNEVPAFKKISGVEYRYELRFEGPVYEFKKAHLFLDGNPEFYLVGTVEDFATLIAENMNRVHGAGIYDVDLLDQSDTSSKKLEFSGDSCLSALAKVCESFKCEYYLNSAGKMMNFVDKVGSSTSLSFEYHDGLREIRREKISNKDLITRLYPFGSERNYSIRIASGDPTDRKGTFTPLGYKLRLSPDTYPDNYIQQNTATYGIREAIKEFPDIYPHYTGAVTSTADMQHVTDTAIDFDLNSYLLEGTTPKIVFLTGDLAGYEFEIISYDNATKTVYFKTYSDEQDNEWPTPTIKAAIGDEFTFVDIKMPAAYIDAAEAELLTAAAAYLNDMSSPNVAYVLTPDWHNFKTNLVQLEVGDIITVTDTQLVPDSIELRISDFTQSLANPYKYPSVKISDNVLINYAQTVSKAQNDIRQSVTISKDNVITRTRRGYQQTIDLQGMIFDTDDYFNTDNIRPLSIETGMITVGMKSQQLVLRGVEFNPSPGGVLTAIEWTAGYLDHLTINESGITTWTISSGSNTSLSQATSYYVYARCAKASSSGTIIVTTTQYIADSGSYYYFLLGVLHAAVSNQRAFSLIYGSTTIAGRMIKTGIIQSEGGDTYFDLDNNELVIAGGAVAGLTISEDKLQFTSGTAIGLYTGGRRLMVSNNTTDEGVELRRDYATSVTNGVLVRMGLLHTKDTLTWDTKFGFEIISNVRPDLAKHVIRIAEDGATLSGWNIDNEAIYTGTKKTSDGYSTLGITQGSNGSIHAPRFYINSDGSIGLRSSVSGKRIVIDSTNNSLKFYDGVQTAAVVTIDDSTSYDSNAGLEVYKDLGSGNYKRSIIRGDQIIQTTVNGSSSYSNSFQPGFISVGSGSTSSLFTVLSDTSLFILMANLPTSASGLSSNTLYRDGNFIKIV